MLLLTGGNKYLPETDAPFAAIPKMNREFAQRDTSCHNAFLFEVHSAASHDWPKSYATAGLGSSAVRLLAPLLSPARRAAPGVVAETPVVRSYCQQVQETSLVRMTLMLLSTCFLTLASATNAAAQDDSQPVKVVARQDIVYGRVQGAGLLADIAHPEGKGPFPAILSVHGGRWVASHKTDPGEGAINVSQWAGYGFFAMSIDYRLAGCSPPPACYQDMLCAIRWVHAHADEYQIDARRIFLIGMSAGGHLVSLAATLGDGPFPRTGGWDKQPTNIRGVISLSAPYDLEKLSWGGNWAAANEQGLAARRLASPIQHVSEKNKPILIIHSDDDGSVPLQQALDMAQTLEKAKAPHRLSVHKKQGHMRVTDEVIKEARAFIEEVSKRGGQ